MIEVKNLVKKYGDHIAVDHLSFTVEEGHIYGFLGPNGAGKSTTMNMITGYIGPTEGSIMINGHDMLENPEEAKKCIGYLPEIPPLYTDMTPLEYLRFAAELKGIARNKKEEEVQKVIADAKLEAVSDRLIRNLSKGYKQRVGIAGAMVGDPEILIFDEPTVGLDPKQILEIRDLIRDLSEKHTILLSSHIMQEVSAVCNEIIIINEGKMIVKDKPENISAHIEQTHELTMEIKGNKELVRSILSGIEHITEYKVTDSEDDEICKAIVISEADSDIRETVFYALAENKCAILEMHTKEPSLEETFIRLTGNGSRQMAERNSRRRKKEGK